MKSIYLVSDIHASNKVFEDIGKNINCNEPLYILGDILDDKDSNSDEYRLLIKNIYNGLIGGYVKSIIGNHDALTYNLLKKPVINTSEDAKQVFENISSVYSTYTYDTITKLFGHLFFQHVYDVQTVCIEEGVYDSDVDYFTVVETYYDNIEKGINLMNGEELECYKQLLFIAKRSKMYEQIEWKGKVYLLSHTGNKENPWSIDIYSSYFEPLEKIDYYIVGHISHDSIQKVSNIPMDEYNLDCNLANVEGIYVYHEKNKLINIDNGTKSNVVRLS